MALIRSIPFVLQLFVLISNVPACRSAGAPMVTLDYGTFRGLNSAGDTESFLGIPFAQEPVGQLRFNNPVPPLPFSGIRDATWFGNACPQQLTPETFYNNPAIRGVLPYIEELLPTTLVANNTEDCLYLNVVKPAGISAGADLPVVVWIYGGAFETGDASGYNGTQIISRSVGLKMPVIFVSFNYRLNAFGFLGGKEVQAAGLGNFGLYDQRLALEWVQKYIYLFGGNSQQVTLWGQSAGAMSVLLQMVAFDGQSEGLFHGAVMESGSFTPNFDITSPRAQDNYDLLLAQTNCSSAGDTLDCLRQAPYESIYNAVLQTPSVFSYQAGNVAWGPLVDGVFLKQSTRQLVKEGKYMEIPAILGDTDDEGTLFSLTSLNVTTNEEFVTYLQSNFLVDVPQEYIQKVATIYKEDPALGSPYDVGTNDTLTPEYKRIASFQGDFYFQAPRRYTLHHLSRAQNVWGYLWKRNKTIPTLGSFHGSDFQEFYDITGTSDWVGTDAIVNFANNFNPNAYVSSSYPVGAVPSLLEDVYWPLYDEKSPLLLTLEDPNVLTLRNDTFRAKHFQVLDEVQALMGV